MRTAEHVCVSVCGSACIFFLRLRVSVCVGRNFCLSCTVHFMHNLMVWFIPNSIECEVYSYIKTFFSAWNWANILVFVFEPSIEVVVRLLNHKVHLCIVCRVDCTNRYLLKQCACTSQHTAHTLNKKHLCKKQTLQSKLFSSVLLCISFCLLKNSFRPIEQRGI